jgi:deazaflavin-dependent oxidoreductase (nitroreductase family)
MPANLVQKGMVQTHRAIFRASKGRLGGKMGKAPVLLLTTTGRKSGQPRTSPLFFQPDGDRLVIIASNGGSSRHPSWYLNLLANPDVTVELEGQSRQMRVRTASDDERARLWPAMQAVYKGYDGYQRKTERHIPLVILEPV